MRPPLLIAASLALFALIGFLDWLSGTQLRVFPLYFIPIVLVASRMARRYALASAIVASIVWGIANSMAGYDEGVPVPIQVANAGTMLISFALVSVLFAELRLRLLRERESSRTDALTELPNRRGFTERVGLLLAASRRSGRTMTLAYIDLDHFKAVNDEHGHATGDAALRAAANVLRMATRLGDVVGRLGGDELAALLPDTTSTRARTVLERLRSSIAETMTEQGLPITASIGAITFNAADLDLTAALSGADRAMYEAKQRGRNRVHVEEIGSANPTAS